MKKVLTILAITLLPFLSLGQEANTTNDTVKTAVEKGINTEIIKKETTAASAIKAQVIKINRKKSTDIISIKAYRKSLHIKVKEVRVC